jgi:hypothetical protein
MSISFNADALLERAHKAEAEAILANARAEKAQRERDEAVALLQSVSVSSARMTALGCACIERPLYAEIRALLTRVYAAKDGTP